MNLIKMCKTCFSRNGNLINISEDTALYNMVVECTSEEFTKSLSDWICIECTNLIKIFYQFTIRCKVIEKTLQQYSHLRTEECIELLIEKIQNNVSENKIEELNIFSSSRDEDLDCHSNVNHDSIYSDEDTIIKKDKNKINIINNSSTDLRNIKTKKIFECQVCKKKLGSSFSLHRHEQIHDNCRKFTHICAVCQKGFYEKGNLIKHMRRHNGDKLYSCPECQKHFYDLSTLLKHTKAHTNLVPSMKCQFCNDVFLVQAQLNVHMKLHHTSHKCKNCGKQFNYQYLLKRHQSSHLNEKPYQCTLCSKAFKQSVSLDLHLKRHNGLQEREICNVCGFAFSNIKMHMMKHTIERPHKCKICSKGLRTTVHLREHMRKHTGEKRKPNILCTVCGKKLLDTTKMRVHMRAHTGERPYQCNVCEQKFISNYSLTVHLRSHTDDKPYTCTTCGREFKTSSSLTIHNRTHTGARPYSCRICEKTFTQSGAMKKHLNTHPILLD